jgi:hypothetical protein
MTKTTQILLILSGVILLLGAGLVGAGVYWWKDHGAALIATMAAADTAGRKFGAGTDDQGCVTEALSPARQTVTTSTGTTEMLTLTAFLLPCLKAARVTPGFCDGVPVGTLSAKSIAWTEAECARLVSPGPLCSNVMANVEHFCDPASRGPTGAGATA